MKKFSVIVHLLLVLILILQTQAYAGVKLSDAESIREFYGLDQFETQAPNLRDLKIAVIDNGFSGFREDPEILPAATEMVETYPQDFLDKYSQRFDLGELNKHKALTGTDHGRRMAQIVWAMTDFNPAGPKFYLLNGNGGTNFKRAVAYAIAQKVDVVLYSHNSECCGNFDGEGIVNDIVSKATATGIIWINAAGNYRGKVYNGKVQIGRNNLLKFDKSQALRFKSNLDANQASVILSWTSEANTDESIGTDKDLDMYVYNEDGELVGSSELVQVVEKSSVGLPNSETLLSRESIELTNLQKNYDDEYYYVQIKAKGSFSDEDRLRLTVFGQSDAIYDAQSKTTFAPIDFTDATEGGEIMVPADHPQVIAVGDLTKFSSQGTTRDGREKPDVILENSNAAFSDGYSTEGTSNAAAYFAGIVAVLKSTKPSLTRQEILNFQKASTDETAEDDVEEAPVEYETPTDRIAVIPSQGPYVRHVTRQVVYQSGGWGWMHQFQPPVATIVCREVNIPVGCIETQVPTEALETEQTSQTVQSDDSNSNSNRTNSSRKVWKTPKPSMLN